MLPHQRDRCDLEKEQLQQTTHVLFNLKVASSELPQGENRQCSNTTFLIMFPNRASECSSETNYGNPFDCDSDVSIALEEAVHAYNSSSGCAISVSEQVSETPKVVSLADSQLPLMSLRLSDAKRRCSTPWSLGPRA